MRRKIFFLLIAMFCVFALSMSLLGAKSIKLHRDYTLAYEVFHVVYDDAVSDTQFFYLPVLDTTVDTNQYGEVDTVMEEVYPWPSVYDQNSSEWISDSLGVASIHTYDRWAMEDWAIAVFFDDHSIEETDDSVYGRIQYQFPGAPGWTVPYTLFSNISADAYIHTYYPLDLYDNWKLYKRARIMIYSITDSVSVQGFLVGRQILQHRHVDPGE